MSPHKIGLVVFAIGVIFMFLGGLLSWYLLPLYLQYGPTKEFLARVPLIVLNVWPLLIPVGAILAVLGGLIYGSK